jgi:hypothetical protein
LQTCLDSSSRRLNLLAIPLKMLLKPFSCWSIREF